MHGAQPLTELILLLVTAAAGAAIFERLRLPSIAGFLIVGACVGPGGVGLVSDPETVRRVAEFGVIFLLFEIGLELPMERLHQLVRRGMGVGALQVSLTLAVVALGAWQLLDVPGRQALVLGALVAMSSTALVIHLLSSRGELDAPHGQLCVAILLFQDLCIVPFLLAVPMLANPAPLALLPILIAFAQVAVALLLFFIAIRTAVPPLLKIITRLLPSREVFSLVAVALVLGAALVAEEIGLTFAVGAFLAGLAASASPYSFRLFSEVVPLRGVLLGIFFSAIGMLLDLRVAWENISMVLAFALSVTVLKGLIAAASVRVFLARGGRVALRTGLSLAQTGEFSFVLAVSAVGAGLLGTELEQSFVAASVLSLLLTPFLFRAGPWLAFGRERSQGEGAAAAAFAAPESERVPAGHVLLIGLGMAGRNMARVLNGIDVPWQGVELNPSKLDAHGAGVGKVSYGDATRLDVLQRVGAAQARMVVIAISDPVAVRRIVALVHELAPEVPLIVRTRQVGHVDALYRAGARRVVAEELEGAVDLVSQVLQTLGLPSGAVARFADELRGEGYALMHAPPALLLDPWLLELLQRVDAEWIDVPANFPEARSLGELDFSARSGGNVLALARGGLNTPNPAPGAELRAGDRLLVFGSAKVLQRAQELLAEEAAGAPATPAAPAAGAPAEKSHPGHPAPPAGGATGEGPGPSA